MAVLCDDGHDDDSDSRAEVEEVEEDDDPFRKGDVSVRKMRRLHFSSKEDNS